MALFDEKEALENNIEIILISHKEGDGFRVTLKSTYFENHHDDETYNKKEQLINIKERLFILYGSRSNFSTMRENDFFVVSFWMSGENIHQELMMIE